MRSKVIATRNALTAAMLVGFAALSLTTHDAPRGDYQTSDPAAMTAAYARGPMNVPNFHTASPAERKGCVSAEAAYLPRVLLVSDRDGNISRMDYTAENDAKIRKSGAGRHAIYVIGKC